VRIQTNSERLAGVPVANVTTDCNTDGDFSEVRNKRKTKNHRTNVTSDVTRGGERRNGFLCQPQVTEVGQNQQNNRTQKHGTTKGIYN